MKKSACSGIPDKHLFVGYHFWVCISLIFLSVVRLDSLGLDDDCRVAAREWAAFGGDRARDIARGQPHGHRDGGGDSHSQVFDGLQKALFLNVG